MKTLSPEIALDILQRRPDARLVQTKGASGAEFSVCRTAVVSGRPTRRRSFSARRLSSRTAACLAIPRRAGGFAMHEPLPRRTAVQIDVAVKHVLGRDIETRSTIILKKVGAHKYAADPARSV